MKEDARSEAGMAPWSEWITLLGQSMGDGGSGAWAVELRDALVLLLTSSDEPLRKAAEFWLAAQGAWMTLAKESDAQRAEVLLLQIGEFLARGTDQWFAALQQAARTDEPGGRKKRKRRRADDPRLHAVERFAKAARLALRGDLVMERNLPLYAEAIAKSQSGVAGEKGSRT